MNGKPNWSGCISRCQVLGIAILISLIISDVQSFQPIAVSLSYRRYLTINTSSILQIYNYASTKTSLSSSSTDDSGAIGTSKKKKRKGRHNVKRRRQQREPLKNPNEIETWRIYGIDCHPDELTSSSSISNKRKEKDDDMIQSKYSYLSPPVLSSLLSRLRIKKQDTQNDEDFDTSASTTPIQLPPQLKDAYVVRRSIDARRRRGADPKFTYVIDITLTREVAIRELKLMHQPGKMERLGKKKPASTNGNMNKPITKPKIIIVGAGPAGLFCALSLASSGLFTPILLERGLPVEGRGKSIGALINRRTLDSESNFSFGEGGAGTWSDGKLTTRIGRNSGAVRFVLETLVKYGAPERILVEGKCIYIYIYSIVFIIQYANFEFLTRPAYYIHMQGSPHLGTDNLVRLLRNMREDLRSMGGQVEFGACVNKFHVKDGKVEGVDAKCIPVTERSTSSDASVNASLPKDDPPITNTFKGDAFVLATGHSARDVYYELHDAGVQLESKGFAVGFRIEHPQRIINEIQYGKDWGGRVFTQRASTDIANTEHFAENKADDAASSQHTGNVPVASYRLATNEAYDGKNNRGAYSFCMCPGGQIVPSSTEPNELCINGMSFSRRDSLFANSALVVTVNPDDEILDKYRAEHGNLAGLEFQRDMEREAFKLGGCDMSAPVQRLTDFVNQRKSQSIPPSSYRLGVKTAELHDIYPKPIYEALSHALVNHFDKQMPGFLCDEALLHGVETRTSSPVRILRDDDTLQARGLDNLFPSGEGAGFAGGIVSAAVDGLMVAQAIQTKFVETSSEESKNSSLPFEKTASVGFQY